MMVFITTIVFLICLLSIVECQPSLEFQLLDIFPNTYCQDGSLAKIYFRNCTANWDSHSGIDYCANITDTWVINFATDSLFPTNESALGGSICYSEESCSSRDEVLKSSIGLNSTAFLQGVVIPYAEVNPNLYKQHSVVVPYCTSDLFAGDDDKFQGHVFIKNTILQLYNLSFIPQGMGPSMVHADRIIIIGGAGVMAQLDEINDLILETLRTVTRNDSATVPVFGICDGCLLFNVTPTFVPPACSTDKNCPAPLALTLFDSYSRLYRPKGCLEEDASSCYLAPAVSKALLNGETPIFVQSQLFDQVQLLSYGISSFPNASVSEQTWAVENFVPQVRNVLRQFNYTFSSACAIPSSLTLSRGYYQLTTRFEDIYGNIHRDALDVAISSFLEDAAADGFGPSVFGSYGDICEQWLCGTCDFDG